MTITISPKQCNSLLPTSSDYYYRSVLIANLKQLHFKSSLLYNYKEFPECIGAGAWKSCNGHQLKLACDEFWFYIFLMKQTLRSPEEVTLKSAYSLHI